MRGKIRKGHGKEERREEEKMHEEERVDGREYVRMTERD